MSYWTHVNGSLRIDCPHPVKNLDFTRFDTHIKNLFKVVHAHGSKEEWEACNIPYGSEGSLDVNIWINPELNYVARYTINFFGDLRDFEDYQHIEIVNWINELIIKNRLDVRAGIMTIDDRTYQYMAHYDDFCNLVFMSSGFEIIHKLSNLGAI